MEKTTKFDPHRKEFRDEHDFLTGVEITCTKCGREEYVGPDHKYMAVYHQIPDAWKSYVCKDCWKKSNDEEKSEGPEIGQSINLAQAEGISKGLTGAGLQDFVKLYAPEWRKIIQEIKVAEKENK